MDNSSRVMRVLAGAWDVLGLVGVFKLALVITGQYTVNWSQELGLMMPIVITSAAAVTVLTNRSAARRRGDSADTANDGTSRRLTHAQIQNGRRT